MKNLYTKNEFMSIRKEESLNEGILGNIFNKIKGFINKIQGGKELDKIYQKYLIIIDNEFKKQAQVDLHLTAEPDKDASGNVKHPKKDNTPIDEKYNLNEALEKEQPAKAVSDEEMKKSGEVATKMTPETLRKKSQILDKILTKYQEIAKKEMNNFLVKKGGAEKNPKLKLVIDYYIDKFELEFLNKKISYLEQSGDKVAAQKIAAERNKLAKEMRANVQQTEPVTVDIGDNKKLTVGNKYRYNSEGKIKIISFIGKADEQGKIKAKYVLPEYGKLGEQPFTIDNLDLGFEPKQNKTYEYVNKDGQKVHVKVIGKPDNNGLVDVSSDDKKFKVNKNALGSEVKTTTTEAKPETQGEAGAEIKPEENKSKEETKTAQAQGAQEVGRS